ncbi:hypothetical protein LSUE1_G006575 [Lachnellula suecica]|uniref:Uncharacterized protein n=1 Tax=Lachnellula suecica TaxID=602035 RepID=A0A8T9C6T0_9HELO|nr:hypothetical protein LSUE1_G006575 [Lachnellula suecica]
MGSDRFTRLTELTPRRFHITANPPFGVGFVLCGHVNEGNEDDTGSQFFNQRGGIANCKPGIWTSMTRQVGDPGDDFSLECILRWVEPGTIDLSQSVQDWEAYERETREKDLEVKSSKIVPEGTTWQRAGQYLMMVGSAAKLMFGTENGEEELDFEFYTETLTLNGWEMGAGANARFTIGGMNYEVGGPPRVAIAEKDGKVIAVRIYGGPEYDNDDSEGREEGFSSDEETAVVGI